MSKDLIQKYEDFREFSVAQWIMMKVPQKETSTSGQQRRNRSEQDLESFPEISETFSVRD